MCGSVCSLNKKLVIIVKGSLCSVLSSTRVVWESSVLSSMCVVWETSVLSSMCVVWESTKHSPVPLHLILRLLIS